jgi:hypothetical protein
LIDYWEVVVRLDPAGVNNDEVLRGIASAAQRRGAFVTRQDDDLTISIRDQDDAEALAAAIKRIVGVLDAYAKPPVTLP